MALGTLVRKVPAVFTILRHLPLLLHLDVQLYSDASRLLNVVLVHKRHSFRKCSKTTMQGLCLLQETLSHRHDGTPTQQILRGFVLHMRKGFRFGTNLFSNHDLHVSYVL